MVSDDAEPTLRPARPSDANDIKSLVRQARLNPFGLDWKRFTVLDDGLNRVLGCIQLKVHGSGARELASLVVAPDSRGRGFGTVLVHHVQLEHGPPLWLMCAPELERYYRRFGFRMIDDASIMVPYFRRIYYLSLVVRCIAKRLPVPVIMLWDSDPQMSSAAR